MMEQTSIVAQSSNPSLVITWGAGLDSWLSGTQLAGVAVNLSGTTYPALVHTEAFADAKLTDEYDYVTSFQSHSHAITVTEP